MASLLSLLTDYIFVLFEKIIKKTPVLSTWRQTLCSFFVNIYKEVSLSFCKSSLPMPSTRLSAQRDWPLAALRRAALEGFVATGGKAFRRRCGAGVIGEGATWLPGDLVRKCKVFVSKVFWGDTKLFFLKTFLFVGIVVALMMVILIPNQDSWVLWLLFFCTLLTQGNQPLATGVARTWRNITPLWCSIPWKMTST